MDERTAMRLVLVQDGVPGSHTQEHRLELGLPCDGPRFDSRITDISPPARFAPAMFRYRKRQFAADPTCVSHPIFNFDFHKFYLKFYS